MMKPSALGHERVKSPDTVWARMESLRREQPGRPETAVCQRGVLSGIVVGGRESRPRGEGPDGSTQRAKETHAGHAGSEQHEPTSLRAIANRAKESKHHRFRNLYQEVNAELLKHCWQDLNKDAASGVDGLTAETYALNLEENITDLAERVRAKRYRAKLVRRLYIPKENGKERPLGIPALEDKLVQLACAKLLGAIYEEGFLDCSYGYRSGRSAKEAVCELTFELMYGKFGFAVEADIRGFFDHLAHDWLVEHVCTEKGKLRAWLKAGYLERGMFHPNAIKLAATGTSYSLDESRGASRV